MKKRCLAFALLCTMLLALLPPAQAATEIIFVTVNDSFQPLSDSTMPVRRGGQLYVPYSVFSKNLGLYVSYTSSDQVLVIFNWDHSLTFDLKHGVTYDENDVSYANQAIFHNETVYVCLSDVVAKMGIYSSYISDSAGAVIRLAQKKPALSDNLFIYFARDVMVSMRQDYEKAGEEPTVTPGGEDDPGEETKAPRLALTFDQAPSDHTGEILDALAAADVQATFFLSADRMLAHPDLTRRIVVEGHQVGLAGENDDRAAFSLDSLDEAAQVLDKLTWRKSRLVRPPDGTNKALPAATARALEEEGYILWGWRVKAPEKGSAASLSSNVVASVRNRRSTVVRLVADERTADAMPGLLDALKRADATYFTLEEWLTPLNFQ